MSGTTPLTRRAIFDQAWPIIIAQALVPTVALVDTIVIGRTGDAAALAGVALGASVVTLIFWAFGFLRMGMTGMTAQASGSGDGTEVRLLLLRGLLIGISIGAAIFALYPLFLQPVIQIMGAPASANSEAAAYAVARMAGAPAALACFAINGWLFGTARTKAALALQIVMNGANILFDLILVSVFHLGPLGVGIGTASAEWLTLIVGMFITFRVMDSPFAQIVAEARTRLIDAEAMRRLFAVNSDIMIRTLALLSLFTWFTHAGARQGTHELAANHVLMQFVTLSAFVLDAFAFTAEERVGAAIGARSRDAYARSVRLTAEFTMAAGLCFTALYFAAGGSLIRFMTTDESVRAIALVMLPYAALIPAIGGPSWLLDGIFIGATETRAMRNATLIVLMAYLSADWLLRPLGNHGVWLALLGSYVARAGTLALHLPALKRRHGLIG
ncbi:MAG: MATE family efflux transporter [Sphingobium sp.]